MKKMHPIVWAILCLPVVYFAMVTASVYIPGENIFALLERISTMVRRPDLLRWTAYTPRFLLVFLLLYGGGVLLYYADHENRRPGEEYGSAKWGNARELNKRYAERDGKNVILTKHVSIGLDGYRHRRNLNILVVGGSGSGKTRFFCKPGIMSVNCSYLIVDPKGEMLRSTGYLLKDEGYDIKVFDLIHPRQSDGYNPFTYIRDDPDVLKLMDNLVKNTTPPKGASNDPFWEKAEIALDSALMLYLLYEAPVEEQNFEMLMFMLECARVMEEDEQYQSPLDLLFQTLEERDPSHIAVREYKVYKQAAGVVCSKRLLNQAVRKSLRTHNLKPKKGAQVMRKNEKITALYERLSRDDFGKDDDQQRESNSISNQELICKGWFLPPNTYDCGSFVVNGTAVVGKEPKHSITAGNQHTKELTFMKSLFEQMGGTYHQVGDYLIPNLSLPEESDYQIGKYGRMRRSYLKEYHPVLYANYLTSGTLHRHLAEIDQACHERMEIVVSAMAKQEGVIEALKAADQMEWVRRMNSIHSRAEEIVLTELVYA